MTPLVLVPNAPNTSGLQLSKLLAGGASTVSSPLGVDSLGNVVLGGYLSPQVATVEFTLPLAAYSFMVSVGGAAVGQNVLCSIAGNYPGSLPDEFEMEPIAVAGMVYATNTVMFTVATMDAQVLTIGKKTIIYELV